MATIANIHSQHTVVCPYNPIGALIDTTRLGVRCHDHAFVPTAAKGVSPLRLFSDEGWLDGTVSAWWL